MYLIHSLYKEENTVQNQEITVAIHYLSLIFNVCVCSFSLRHHCAVRPLKGYRAEIENEMNNERQEYNTLIERK